MADTGFSAAGTGVSDSSIGTLAWTNPGNITSSDNVYASAGDLTGLLVTQYLKATNFGFSVPAGATINGIELVVEHSMSNISVGKRMSDTSVKLVKGGTIGGTNLATSVAVASTTDANITYGGPSQLWGSGWTDTDVNSSTFGAAISYTENGNGGTIRVDQIRIKVYYTAGGGGSFIAQANPRSQQAVNRASTY